VTSTEALVLELDAIPSADEAAFFERVMATAEQLQKVLVAMEEYGRVGPTVIGAALGEVLARHLERMPDAGRDQALEKVQRVLATRISELRAIRLLESAGGVPQ
jgi:hypothetical protein